MKYLIAFVSIVSLASFVYAVPGRWNNGQIEFAVGQVGNQLCWTQQQFQQAQDSADVFSATSPVTSMSFTPSALEVALSTGGLVFSSYSEFRALADDSEALRDRIDDLPPSQGRKLRRSIDHIRSEDAKR